MGKIKIKMLTIPDPGEGGATGTTGVPLIWGDTFQDPQSIPGGAGSTGPYTCIYYVFLIHTHTYDKV